MESLSELEMRILAELEEAGQEDVATVMNTVFPPTGDESELDEVQTALAALSHAGFVRMSMDRDAAGRLRDLPPDDSASVIADLKSGLSFRKDIKGWVGTRYSAPPYGDPFPYIVNTEAGAKKGFEILDERGYQWWRAPK